MNTTDNNIPAIISGIKAVGVGKTGSKHCPPDVITALTDDLKNNRVDPVARAAFFAALWIKGISEHEYDLAKALPENALNDSSTMIDYLMPHSPANIKIMGNNVLNEKFLSLDDAKTLGEFLFQLDDDNDDARAFFASALRVRYETPEEYQGILHALNQTIAPAFQTSVAKAESIIQLAEPFDGLNRSYLITPLLAKALQGQGFRVVNMVGRSSGPKYGLTLQDLMTELKQESMTSNNDLSKNKPPFGWCLDQKDLSPAADHWVDIRHKTIKRPFMATLEKLMNPVQADIFIASAFHAPYTEKMVDIAERQGYPAIITTFRSIEGSLGQSLARSMKLICSVRQTDGSYKREALSFAPESCGFAEEKDIRLENPGPDVKDNARLIQQHHQTGTSGNSYFDHRVAFSIHVFTEAIKCCQTLQT